MGKIYGCFRANPIKKGAPKGNLKKHCEATQEYAEAQKMIQMKAYGYSEIEPENVKYNKVLVDCPESYEEKIRDCQREKFGGRTIRHDGIPMIDTVFFYSPEKTPNLLCHLHRKNAHWKKEHADWWEAYESTPKEERRESVSREYRWVQDWAAASEKWAEENLGEVIHCVLHCHEGTPHLDCKTLAIKYSEEKKKYIWAKREILGNKRHLSNVQTKYYEECGSKFGLERGEIRETGELRKHAETERHMADEARKQVEGQVEQARDVLDTVRFATADAQAELGHVQAELEQLQAARGNVQAALEQPEAEIRAAGDRLMEGINDMVRAHDGLRRTLNVARHITERQRKAIEIKRDKTDARTTKALENLDGIDAIMAAAEAVERAKDVYATLKCAAKGDTDALDDLVADDDFGR